MSYLTCTNCLQKSPDTATRCKHCGRAFGRAPEARDSGSGRSFFPTALLLGGAALIIVAAYQLWPRFSVAPSPAPPDTQTVAAPPPPTTAPTPASKESRAAPVDSVRSVLTPPPKPREQPPPPAADTARPMGDTARPVSDTARPAAASVAIDVARQRYAQVWANLRAERSNTASILQVLHPGEVVAVDSLQQGWYRVVTDQQAVGYVDQQYLDTLPPRAP